MHKEYKKKTRISKRAKGQQKVRTAGPQPSIFNPKPKAHRISFMSSNGQRTVKKKVHSAPESEIRKVRRPKI